MFKISLFPGDGIGPEITDATLDVLKIFELPLIFDRYNVGTESLLKTGELISEDAMKSIEINKIALKGPTATPVGTGHRSLNVLLRKKYDLFSNVRPVRHFNGVKTPFNTVDLVIFRENTEDLYAGVEIQISPDECHAIKIITRKASERIAKQAFEYACKHGKHKVTAVHKANIMKQADGLFLEAVRHISKSYPSILLEEVIVDNMCMQLVTRPDQFEVIVTENLYGDILSDLCAGLVGGLGLVPGANIGDTCAIFEAVHGSAPDIAGKGLANPIALMLSASMMLDYLQFSDAAKQLIHAIENTLSNEDMRHLLTPDLGGMGTTHSMTEAIKEQLITIRLTKGGCA